MSACSTSITSSSTPTPTSTKGSSSIIHEYALHPSQSPGNIVAGPDGNLWFTEFQYGGGTGKIESISTAGKISEFPVPTTGDIPKSITFGMDHILWFIEVEGTPTDPYGKNGKVGHLN